jgi:hypothetical protein
MLALRIGQHNDSPDPYFVNRGRRAVDISDGTRKCVAFIGIRQNDKFVPKATCFFVNYIEDQRQFDYIVTAEHVVSGLLTRGHDIWLRANLVDGDCGDLPIKHDAFYFHPDDVNRTDVAVAPLPSWRTTDQETQKEAILDIRTLGLNGKDSFAPTEAFAEEHMGLGGQVVIVGLFRSHYGQNRNIPIVRIGNIAARLEEPVHTNYAGYIDAYLVETRSIAGLSGSPVFALPELASLIAMGLTSRGQNYGQLGALMGLVHGHFDVKNLNEDVVNDMAGSSINTGIGVVIPFQKILETIEQPELTAMRKAIVAKLRKSGATADLDFPSVVDKALQPNDENPTHREDFTSLLGAAARKQQPND